MPVLRRTETFSYEIPKVAETDYEDVAYVGREEDVIGGLLLGDALVGRSLGVLGRVAVLLVGAVPEL